MSQRTRSLLLGLAAGLLLGPAACADAFWISPGAGTGTGPTATMPAGNPPAASVSGQNVTVSWAQSSFAAGLLGTYAGGGYTVTRYAAGGSTPITPSANCATKIGGAGATLQCIEAAVPYGAWQYVVTPVLNSFTGAASAKSAAVTVVTAAPVLNSVTAQNPAVAQTTGDLALTWAAVTGATGYNVYRRVSGGSFDYGAPRNGVTPISTTAYSDPGAGLSAATTYDYVVRAVAGCPAVESASSGSLSAATITRPAAPASVTATAAPAAAIDVAWASVRGAAGYNVYRTSTGVYGFASPSNGGSPVTGLGYTNAASDAITYRFIVRAVIVGAGDAPVESANSVESGAVTADGVLPPTPTALEVLSGGPGTTSVDAPSHPAPASSTTGSAQRPDDRDHLITRCERQHRLHGDDAGIGRSDPGRCGRRDIGCDDVRPQRDARRRRDPDRVSKDAAGNVSPTKAPEHGHQGRRAGAQRVLHRRDLPLGGRDRIEGTSECGATIIAVRPSEGRRLHVFAADLESVQPRRRCAGAQRLSYDVTATDLAANKSAVTVVSGTAVL